MGIIKAIKLGFDYIKYGEDEKDNEKIRAIMEKYDEDLKHEVLARSISFGSGAEGSYEKEWTVNGEKVTLAVRKI
jgi:isoleucyl-tRNA synthetase